VSGGDGDQADGTSGPCAAGGYQISQAAVPRRLWAERTNVVGPPSGSAVGGDDNAVVLGGEANSVTGNGAAGLGGYDDAASGYEAITADGSFNQATESCAAVIGGASNQAAGDHSAVAGGNSNVASGEYSAVAGGTGNVASATLGVRRRFFEPGPGTVLVGRGRDEQHGRCPGPLGYRR
jgi:hypothetical protein